MYCGQCGVKVPDTNKFCTKCGAPLNNTFVKEDTKDYLIVHANTDTLDYSNHQELVNMLRKVKNTQIIVDLTKVRFVDSVGIGSLVTLSYTAARKKQDIKYVIKSKKATKTVETLGVQNILEIYGSVEEAKAEWGITG